MNRRTLGFLIPALLLSFSGGLAQESANLIVNPEFNLSKAGWTAKAYGSANTSSAVNTDTLLSGPNSLTVKCTAGGAALDDVIVYQSKTLQKGRFYHMRFMAMASVPHTIRVGIETPSGERQTLWQSDDIPVGTAPERFGAYEFHCMLPDGSYKFKFMIGGRDNVDVHLDSVSMTWVDDPNHLREEEKFTSHRHPYDGHSLPYRLFSPPPVNCGPGENCIVKYPLILALHGAGERGTDNVLPMTLNNLAFSWSDSANQAKHPCYVVVPQCPLDQQWVNAPWINGSYRLADTPISWPLAAALDLVDSLIQNSEVDSNRVYVSGLSMGGFGAYDCILRHPERFAAAIPLSGAGDPTGINGILDMPVWDFHGDQDTSVPVSGSRDMMTAFENAGRAVVHTHCYMGACAADPNAVMDSALAAGAKRLYTEYKGMGHQIWVESYNLPQVHDWVFSQSKTGGSAVREISGTVPVRSTLSQNYPNPFNPSTTIRYRLTGTSRVRLIVYDVNGRKVTVLKDGVETAGEHSVLYDASGLASGQYLVGLFVDGNAMYRKILRVQ
jgi:predicted peptidase